MLPWGWWTGRRRRATRAEMFLIFYWMHVYILTSLHIRYFSIKDKPKRLFMWIKPLHISPAATTTAAATRWDGGWAGDETEAVIFLLDEGTAFCSVVRSLAGNINIVHQSWWHTVGKFGLAVIFVVLRPLSIKKTPLCRTLRSQVKLGDKVSRLEVADMAILFFYKIHIIPKTYNKREEIEEMSNPQALKKWQNTVHPRSYLSWNIPKKSPLPSPHLIWEEERIQRLTHLAIPVREGGNVGYRGGDDDGRSKCCGCWSVAPGGGPSLATELPRLHSSWKYLEIFI